MATARRLVLHPGLSVQGRSGPAQAQNIAEEHLSLQALLKVRANVVGGCGFRGNDQGIHASPASFTGVSKPWGKVIHGYEFFQVLAVSCLVCILLSSRSILLYDIFFTVNVQQQFHSLISTLISTPAERVDLQC